MDKKASTCNSHVLVGAIDFGTTFSSWAYSFLNEFETNPTKVTTRRWSSGSVVTEKTPTCALISPDRKLIAFGYDAENMYRMLAEKNEHTHYFYFRRFKMRLNQENISRDLLIEDEIGKRLPAIDVFSYSIAALVDDMLDNCNLALSRRISKDDVHWVLTVPAIWKDAAKQFMREAATKEPAGTRSENVSVALEPEAASLFCRYLPMDSFKGGTIDITVHEVDSSSRYKEVHAATGGGWGGILVDEAFKDLLIDLIGNQTYQKFASTETEDWLELWRSFEIKKMSVDPDDSNKRTMIICESLRKLCKTETGLEFKDAVSRSKYASKVEAKGDKLRIDSVVMQELFKKSIDTTIACVRAILTQKNSCDVKTILMVGGFSESPMLQKAIQREFSNLTILVPKEASSSIVRGAVIFGHNPRFISQRVLRKTYGKKTTKPFKKGEDDEKYKIVSDTGVLCDKIFDKFVEKGQTVISGKVTQENKYLPINRAQNSIDMEFYASDLTDPKYTDRDCQLIGNLSIDLTNVLGDLNRTVSVSLSFGDPELKATCRVEETGKILTTKLNFLG